jgi:type IV secretion system protein VirB5
MMTKRLLTAVVCAVVAGPVTAQIPVTDAAGLAQAVSQVQALGQQLTTLQSQLTQMQNLYTTATSQLDTLRGQFAQIQTMYGEMTGITGHAGMLSDTLSRLHDFLPTDISLDGVAGELGGQVAALRASLEAFSAADLFGAGPQYEAARETYEERGEAVYTYLALARETYEALRTRRGTIDSLRQAANTATTQKAALDLGNRIAAENALLANDIAELQALRMVVDLELENVRHNEAGRNARRLTAPDDVAF